MLFKDMVECLLSCLTNKTNMTMFTNQSGNMSFFRSVSSGGEEGDNSMLDIVNPTNSSAYMTASMFRNVTVPFICVFGCIGNTMAMVTLLYRRLRHTSCNIYLALRSMSDTLFLLTLLAVWLDSVDVPFYHTEGICQFVVYASYITSFLSIWSVAAITFENYIRICHPTKLNKYCTLCKAKRAVLVLIFVSFLIYESSVWTTGMVEISPGLYMCMTKKEFEHLYIILTYVDTILTLFIPLIVILFLSTCIAYSVINSYKRRIRLRSTMLLRRTNFRFGSTPQAKVTRLLFAVSTTFLVLHTPIHIIKLIMIVKLYILESVSLDPAEAALKTAFENMYYLNFSANFVVFFVCGETFRKVFWELFCGCFKKKTVVLINVEQQTDLTVLNAPNKQKINVDRTFDVCSFDTSPNQNNQSNGSPSSSKYDIELTTVVDST